MKTPVKQRRKPNVVVLPQYEEQRQRLDRRLAAPNDDTTSQRKWHASLLVLRLALTIAMVIACAARLLSVISQRRVLRHRNEASLVPFSTLNADDAPLMRQYSLDEQYWLHNYNNTGSGDTPQTSGIVYFPSSDLSSRVVEDATNIELQRKLVYLASEEELFRDIVPTHHVDPKTLQSEESRALCTLRGYKGGPNQDRSMIAEFFVKSNYTARLDIVDIHKECRSNNGRSMTNCKRAILMGIFDGHGDRGHQVAQHVALYLPKIFARTMREHHSFSSDILPMDARYDDWIRQVFKTTFLEVDKSEPVQGSGGGCTASTVFYPGQGNKLYLASVGDSITIVAHYSKSSRISTIVRQNRQDKPHVDEERMRIESAGGKVYIPFLSETGSGYRPKESSRLIIPLSDGSQLGLAMSRSIGDAEGKPFGLISEPTVEVFDVQDYYARQNYSANQIEDSEWFVVVASDGLFDVIPPEKVVQPLGESLYHDDVESSSLEPVCEHLIRRAGRLWMKSTVDAPYRDDITLGVSKIKLSH